MPVKNNPFTSKVFVKKWLDHFNKKMSDIKFNFINGLTFFRTSHILPIYINIGKNLTKGIFYSFSNSANNDFKKKVFLIYDVPEYFNHKVNHLHKNLKLYKVKQYPGFLIELKDYKDLNEYMISTFSKSSRYKLNKYKKRLESCFDIHYKMFYSEISKDEYNFIFKSFKNLLKKRFLDKKITNNNLDPKEWNFYHDVAFPMILEKKASLFVIYDGKKPISITLNYFSENILFDAITVFDIDYTKFHLGSITIMKLVEWSIDQELIIFDFSKGYFDYKKRWMTKEYLFEYHILYDSKSSLASSIAFLMKTYFKLKQYLRDQKLNEKLHKLSYILKNNKSKKEKILNYTFTELTEEYKEANLLKIDLNKNLDSNLKSIVFDFMYLNIEFKGNLDVYKILAEQSYLIKGKSKSKKVIIN